MFRPTVLAPLLVASTLFAACSFNPLAKRNPQPAPTIAQQNQAVSPQQGKPLSPTFNLFQEGEGRLTLQGRGDRSLRAVSVSGRDRKAELAFEGADGNLVRFSGNLVSSTPTVMIIDFTRSGDADASGSVRVKYDSTTIDSLTGNGVLDGQGFSIEFAQNLVQVPTPPAPPAANSPQAAVLAASKSSAAPTPLAPVPAQPPAQLPAQIHSAASTAAIDLPVDRLVRPDINMSQQGGGVFNAAGQATALSSAAVTGRENGSVDLVLHFADAEQVRFTGSVEQVEQDAGTMVIRLLNSDKGAATGLVTVEYNADHSIQTLLGDGTLDSQPFSIQFSR